ncbi:hypothetical protein AB0O01_28440 [Streptomyces sp. NPDC093252]|uniref:hypothetical protein n=1 Tax=Streptomyces sp. NPDC093252 TaxID=3154980 RepID=UPI00342975DA
MHRTTTTATLLVTVAVSALTGCTTVHPPAAPAPVATPVRPPVPEPDGSSGPQIVQAPAREALELIGPARPHAGRRTAPAARPAVPPPSTRAPVPGPKTPRATPRPRTPAPAPRPSRRPTALPDLADAIGKDVRRQTDVCALGRRYGGWDPDSPESRICEQTNGR